jgi:hypothetical protein
MAKKKEIGVPENISLGRIIGVVVIAVLLIVGVFIFFGGGINFNSGGNRELASGEFKEAEELDQDGDYSSLSAVVDEGAEVIENSEQKYIVDPSKIRSGGPPKGGIGVDKGIPALDERNIKYVSVSDADSWIDDDELVLVLEHNGVKRVYPLQIMVWHEIANDVVGGDPIAVTYCPLCGSGIAYFRVIDGEPVKLGTSGKLFNSNLVMYDDKTDTYWQQIDGNAIVGELTGMEFQELSVDTVVWRDWKEKHGDSEVLSQDTGMNRNYGRDPYGNYYEDSFFIFEPERKDDRVHPKTIVFGIEVRGESAAYRESDLIEKGEIEDTVGGVDIRVERFDDGRVRMERVDTGEEIVKERDMWFAWYAFHPETTLYGVEANA